MNRSIDITTHDVARIEIVRQVVRDRAAGLDAFECLHIRLEDEHGNALATVRAFVTEIGLPLAGHVTAALGTAAGSSVAA